MKHKHAKCVRKRLLSLKCYVHINRTKQLVRYPCEVNSNRTSKPKHVAQLVAQHTVPRGFRDKFFEILRRTPRRLIQSFCGNSATFLVILRQFRGNFVAKIPVNNWKIHKIYNFDTQIDEFCCIESSTACWSAKMQAFRGYSALICRIPRGILRSAMKIKFRDFFRARGIAESTGDSFV